MATYVGNTATTTGWTERWATGEGAVVSSGGNLVISKSSESNEYGVSLDAVDSDGDRDEFEVLAKIRFNTQASAGRTVGVFGWGSGAGGSESGILGGLRYADNDGSDWQPIVLTFQAGTDAPVDFDVGSNVAGTWYWIRFRGVADGGIYARMWVDGDAEPVTWQIGRASGIAAAAGWVGIWAKDTATDTYEVGYFAVATAGDSVVLGGSSNAGFFMGADF